MDSKLRNDVPELVDLRLTSQNEWWLPSLMFVLQMGWER